MLAHYLKQIFVKLIIFSLFFSITLHASEQLLIEPDDGRTPLVNAIKEAKSSINLVMYGFTDHQLLQALINAKRSGKTVQILLEPHPYKAEGENNIVRSHLEEAHIEVQASNPDFKLTHQKAFIFDNQKAIIMTFNLTRSTFKNERNFALVINDPAIAKEINEVFKADWQRKPIDTQSLKLIWSPNDSQAHILQFITSAQHEINIYAQDLTDYKMIGALAKAARNGKKVNVLLSTSQNHHPNKKIAYLQRAGANIHFSRHLIIHAKVIIVDNSKALLGSTNFTYPSMHFNRELSIITQDQHVVKQLTDTFKRDFSTDREPRKAPRWLQLI